MITKERKKEIVADLVEKFRRANGFYLVDFGGMTVADSIRIRREMHKLDVDYRVAKNTLILRALQELGGFDIPQANFIGNTAIVFGYDDPVSPARVISEQFEKFKMPTLKGAVLERQYYDGSQLKALASLPTKKDIMASIVGSLQAPISGIAGAIGAVMRDVAYLIEEVAKKQAA